MARAGKLVKDMLFNPTTNTPARYLEAWLPHADANQDAFLAYTGFYPVITLCSMPLSISPSTIDTKAPTVHNHFTSTPSMSWISDTLLFEKQKCVHDIEKRDIEADRSQGSILPKIYRNLLA